MTGVARKASWTDLKLLREDAKNIIMLYAPASTVKNKKITEEYKLYQMNIIGIHNLTKPNMFILHWKIDKIGKLCSYTTGLGAEAKFKNL